MKTVFGIALSLAILGCGGSSRAPQPASPPPPAPTDPVGRGIELYNRGEFAEAARVLSSAVSLESRDARALTYLGLSMTKSERPLEALEYLNRAVDLDPTSAEAHYGLGLAYGYLNRLPKMVEELEQAVHLDSKHAYAHYQLGLAYNQQDKVDLSILHLERFLQLAPDAPEAPQVNALLRRLRM